jgi:hypothetical protein
MTRVILENLPFSEKRVFTRLSLFSEVIDNRPSIAMAGSLTNEDNCSQKFSYYRNYMHMGGFPTVEVSNSSEFSVRMDFI